ncbi:MAG: hypothetical protein ACR2MD_09670 [Aridibacter sp.]
MFYQDISEFLKISPKNPLRLYGERIILERCLFFSSEIRNLQTNTMSPSSAADTTV